MRVPTIALLLALSACASPSAGPSAGPSSSGVPSTTAPGTPRPTTTRIVIPTPTLPVNPCKLTAAQISAVVGFAVTRKAKNNPGQCEYVHADGGSVWFSVDTQDIYDITRDKNDDTFSLGGKYVTITDETGFAHEAFTAVKNPGSLSPGVIADAMVYLHPGRVQLRIYYPGGGKPPGRQHALTLEHKMVG
jgi:hypothetical protein